ncbi:MAG: alpha/beta hydrolase [Oxalobacteraceae bacterium]|nr:MAG: alpha/beta hydrolase [Oxalobacteraceae bacterium]
MEVELTIARALLSVMFRPMQVRGLLMIGCAMFAAVLQSSGGVARGTSTAARLEPIQVQQRVFMGVPYAEVAVARPRRTILLIHGGPEIPALQVSDQFEGYLARRFRARIVKPVYYGSTERSPWDNTPNLTVTLAMSNGVIRSRLTAAARTVYRGMPQAVAEVRRFLRQWDAASTIVLGESFGAPLAALAARMPHKSHLVLIAPVIATQSEIMRAGLAGRYHPPHPVDPPRLVLNGKDRIDEILDTPLRRRRLLEAISLAYYEPWQNMPLGNMLKRAPGRVSIIVGLRDRVGMVTGQEWNRLRAQAPRSTRICIDPELGHTLPWTSTKGRRCFAQALRLT